jgi:hypothetical protein
VNLEFTAERTVASIPIKSWKQNFQLKLLVPGGGTTFDLQHPKGYILPSLPIGLIQTSGGSRKWCLPINYCYWVTLVFKSQTALLTVAWSIKAEVSICSTPSFNLWALRTVKSHVLKVLLLGSKTSKFQEVGWWLQLVVPTARMSLWCHLSVRMWPSPLYPLITYWLHWLLNPN